MPEWARIINTTTRKFLRGEQNNVLRNRKLTALMRERGRLTYNHSGEQVDWKVRYKRAPMAGYADADTLTFERKNRWKTANLPWRGYAATDSMTQKEKLMNRGLEAIVKIYSGITDVLMEDVEDQFADEFYVDGNAAGNDKRLHGIESFLGDSGATGGADNVAPNSDTYAGLVTTLGNYGGTWNGTWPNGEGDAHYDFWTPVLVNYLSSGFIGTGDTWATQGLEALRFGIIRSQRNKSRKGQLDLILLENQLYEDLLAQLDDKERFVSRPGRNEGSLAKLGFTDVVNFDGVDISWEFGIPTTRGYGFNVDHMELCSLQSQLFEPVGPDFDIASQSYRFSIHFYGNLKCDPRCFVKWDDYAT